VGVPKVAKPGIKNWVMTGFLLLVAGQSHAVQNHLLIISGIAGEEEYRQQFVEMSLSLYRSASEAGITNNNIVMLTAQPVAGESEQHRVSDRQSIHKALMEINVRAQPDDRIFVVLIGHGNSRGDSAVFNLPGPDISAGELAEALEVFEDQALIIINTASASGPFIKALTRDNRIIITATSSGREYNAPMFGELFIAAFAKSGADRDKDERISMLEAFDYARREVRRSYDSDKRLLTEHALLDDNGDGVGSLDPDVDYAENRSDGALANRIYLQQPGAGAAGASSELTELSKRKQDIEQSIGELKKQRASMSRDRYYNRLEVLLIDLALLSREIRAQGG
jgi:hypothetical protein